MKMRFESRVNAPAQDVFDFYRNPANLMVLMEGWPGLQLLHHCDSVRIDTELWVEQTVAGWIPIAMGFRHTECSPPHRFAESLIHGPFSRFDHIHEFEPIGSGCIVRDLLEVALPWYFGGEATIRASVAPALHRAFALREKALNRLFVLAG